MSQPEAGERAWGRIAAGVLLGAAAIGASCFAWADARFAHLRTVNPVKAYAMRPYDAGAIGRALSLKLEEGRGASITDADVRYARASLLAAPLSRDVFKIMAVRAEAAGNSKAADTEMAMADRISRRESFVQLWLIERAVQRDDVPGALTHYNAVLSVHPELGSTLFPILASAISAPDIRKALASYVSRQANWTLNFLDAAVREGNPRDVALLLLPIADSVRSDAYQAIHSQLISRLAQKGDFALARQVAKAMISGFDDQALLRFAVDDQTTDARLGSLAWTFANTASISATANDGRGFSITVDPLANGAAVSRLVPVEGGKTYLFGHDIRYEPGSAMAGLEWQAFCVSSQPKALIWEQAAPKTSTLSHLQAVIHVPQNCRGLEFRLLVNGPDGQQVSSVNLQALELRLQK